jgi:hypothetical protein
MLQLKTLSNTLLWHLLLRGQILFAFPGLLLNAILSNWFHGNNSHNLVSELLEQTTLQGLGREVCHHLPSRAPFHGHFTLIHSISDKEIANIDVLRSLPTGQFAIRFQQDGALVVLMQHVVIHCITLGLEEVSGPTYGWHEIINSNDFYLCRTATIKLLLGGAHYWETTAH